MRSRSTLATTTLRTMTSTRAGLPALGSVTLTSIAFNAASLPSAGAVPITRPPSAGMSRITEQGTVAVKFTGAWEISGAVTFESWPACGQFNVAVV